MTTKKDIICDNLRIFAYYMTHLSKKLYHYGYAYKHQFDEDVLIRNLDLAYIDAMRTNVDGWTNQVRKVETLDFEILVGGHGPVGDKSDVTAGRVYLEELRAAVLAGLKAGKSEDELARSITMDKYKDWIAYDEWRELNVRGTARYLKESGYDK